jgi:hypothetical protein
MGSLFRKPDANPNLQEVLGPTLSALMAGRATVCSYHVQRDLVPPSWMIGHYRRRHGEKLPSGLSPVDYYLPTVDSPEEAIASISQALAVHRHLGRISLGLVSAPLAQVCHVIDGVHNWLVRHHGPARLVVVMGLRELVPVAHMLAVRRDVPRVGLVLQEMHDLDALLHTLPLAARTGVPLGFHTIRPVTEVRGSDVRVGFLNAMVATMMARTLRLNESELREVCRTWDVRFEPHQIRAEGFRLELGHIEDLAENHLLGYEWSVEVLEELERQYPENFSRSA